MSVVPLHTNRIVGVLKSLLDCFDKVVSTPLLWGSPEESILNKWKGQLSAGFVVIAPMVIVNGPKSHYVIAMSWKNSKGDVSIETYDPTGSPSGSKRFSLERIGNTIPQSEKGLQTTDDLCGYHILYWVIYRLKYGPSKTNEMLRKGDLRPFQKFVRELSKSLS